MGHIGVMDGDGNRKKYDSSSYPTVPTIGNNRDRDPPGSSVDRFRQQHLPSSARAAAVGGVLPPQDRTASLAAYAGYGYTDSPSYSTPSLQGGTLQSTGLQYHSDFTSSPSRQDQSTTTHQQGHHPQRLPQYDPEMVYNIAPHAQPQPSYETVSQYQPRHSAAIEVLATQFGVPQYFSGDEPEGPGAAASQYLTEQVQPTQYPHPTPVTRPNASVSFPEPLTDFNHPMAADTLETQNFLGESSSGLEDAYNQYQQALGQTFSNARAGRLKEASQSLLELSDWLLGNAVELGKHYKFGSGYCAVGLKDAS